MNCFPCFSSQRSKKSANTKECASADSDINESRLADTTKQKPFVEKKDETDQIENGNTGAKSFTFRELATATKNFRQECLLGEGGFGRVYKGTLHSTGQVVAVKQLDRHGLHGNKEFLSEVLSLSRLRHPNLVNLIGYCADGDQRLLVYEYMSGGSVEDHLLDIKPDQKPLDWVTRMKIAYGAAQGLEYLHDKANPQLIYRDLKASNILLDEELFPKLCDFGLHKLGPGTGDKMPISSRVMGTYGYCAPEYAHGGNLTIKSDVYSFGVVLLELITGRRAVDTTKPIDEQNLVTWAQPLFRDPKSYPDMADPLLKRQVLERALNQAVAIASMCLQEEAAARPLISDVMIALSFLSVSTEEAIPTAIPILSFKDKSMSIGGNPQETCKKSDRSDSGDEDEGSSDGECSAQNKISDNAIEKFGAEGGTDSYDGSDSDSHSEQEDQEEASDFRKSGKSDFDQSFGSQKRPLENDIASLSCKSIISINSAEGTVSLSNKESKKWEDGSISSRYDSGRDDSLRHRSFNGHLSHNQSQKSDDGSTSSDDSSDDESASSHSTKSHDGVASPDQTSSSKSIDESVLEHDDKESDHSS